MFTGIIEGKGVVTEVTRVGDGLRLRVRPPFAGLTLGESVALNGVCLTVAAFPGEPARPELEFHLSGETLEKTAFAEVAAGQTLNLERAMPAQGRFSGHWVQGHVDGVGRIARLERQSDGSWLLGVEVPPAVLKYCVEKGSLCVHGISLTVNRLHAQGVEIMIIPHTWEQTHLGEARVGSRVNLEADVIAKYVEKFMGARNGNPS
jgi:riboflavin synthase